jgi:hypothetical protein
MLGDRGIEIYNRVGEIIAARGCSLVTACKLVSAEAIAAQPGRNENLSPKAIEKTYRGLLALTAPKKRAIEK